MMTAAEHHEHANHNRTPSHGREIKHAHLARLSSHEARAHGFAAIMAMFISIAFVCMSITDHRWLFWLILATISTFVSITEWLRFRIHVHQARAHLAAMRASQKSRPHFKERPR